MSQATHSSHDFDSRVVTRHARSRGLGFIALTVILLVQFLAGSTPASAQGAFSVTVSDTEIESVTGETTMVLSLDPHPQVVAAISIRVTVDPSLLRIVGVNGLIGSGSCGLDSDRAVRFAGLDVNGWSTQQDLCEFTVTALGSVGTTAVTPEIITAVDMSAHDLVGTVIAGKVTIGGEPIYIDPVPSPDPTAEPTPEPTVEATPEPAATTTPAPTVDQSVRTPQPVAEPEPTVEHTDTVDDPANDTQADTAQDVDAPGEAAERTDTSDRGSRAEAATDEPTPVPLTASAPEPVATDGVDAQPVSPGQDASSHGQGATEADSGPNTSALVATVAIALLTTGGLLAAASRRASRFPNGFS